MSLDDMYKDLFIEIYKNPKNFGKIEYSVKESLGNPSCGDSFTIYLKVKDGVIENASFEGKGCVISTVSSSLLLENIKGKKVEEVKNMEAKEIFKIIGIDLSNNPTRARCALLSLSILKNALKKLDKI